MFGKNASKIELMGFIWRKHKRFYLVCYQNQILGIITSFFLALMFKNITNHVTSITTVIKVCTILTDGKSVGDKKGMS